MWIVSHWISNTLTIKCGIYTRNWNWLMPNKRTFGRVILKANTRTTEHRKSYTKKIDKNNTRVHTNGHTLNLLAGSRTISRTVAWTTMANRATAMVEVWKCYGTWRPQKEWLQAILCIIIVLSFLSTFYLSHFNLFAVVRKHCLISFSDITSNARRFTGSQTHTVWNVFAPFSVCVAELIGLRNCLTTSKGDQTIALLTFALLRRFPVGESLGIETVVSQIKGNANPLE